MFKEFCLYHYIQIAKWRRFAKCYIDTRCNSNGSISNSDFTFEFKEALGFTRYHGMLNR